MKKERKSVFEAVHNTAKGLHDIGLLDPVTLREFDALCLEPVHPLNAKEIKQIRLKESVSQPVFAHYLNVSPSTIKKWETGEKVPSGAALRLLNLVEQKGLALFKAQD